MNRLMLCLAIGTLGIGALTATGHPALAASAEKSAEFKGYRTYSWVFKAPPAAIDPTVYQAVKASVEAQLSRKGYAPAEEGEMAVAITVGRRDRIEKTDWGAYGGDIYTRLGVTPVTGDPGHKVTDGTLAIDIYDSQSKRPVWRGTATEEIRGARASQAVIDKAVAEAIRPLPGAVK